MTTRVLATLVAVAWLAAPVLAQQKVKIGFITTLSGPQAAIGQDMRDAVELALDHLGRKIAGRPVEVIYEDDTFKPDVGKQKSEKLVQQDQVHFVTGYIWSNVLLASLKTYDDVRGHEVDLVQLEGMAPTSSDKAAGVHEHVIDTQGSPPVNHVFRAHDHGQQMRPW